MRSMWSNWLFVPFAAFCKRKTACSGLPLPLFCVLWDLCGQNVLFVVKFLPVIVNGSSVSHPVFVSNLPPEPFYSVKLFYTFQSLQLIRKSLTTNMLSSITATN